MSCQNFGAQEGTFWEDEYTYKLIKFSNVFTPYARKYFGCPINATHPEQCRPNLGVRDWKLEQEVVKYAEIFTK